MSGNAQWNGKFPIGPVRPEKWSSSKGGPHFPELFQLGRTVPLSFEPKFPEVLVEWIAPMTNWKSEFHKPLTRPGVKHDEEISICSSTPQAHRGYINSSLLESDLKMSESHANVVSFERTLVNERNNC